MLYKIELLINKFIDLIGAIAMICLILLVLLVSYNVIARYAFNSSSIGFEELAWHLYSAIFLLGISYALRTASHVRVDIIFESLKPRNKAIIDLFGTIIFILPLCYVVIRYGWDFTVEAFKLGEKSQDPGGLHYRWIVKGLIPLSFLLLLFSAVSFFINKINVLKGLTDVHQAKQNLHSKQFADATKVEKNNK